MQPVIFVIHTWMNLGTSNYLHVGRMLTSLTGKIHMLNDQFSSMYGHKYDGNK